MFFGKKRDASQAWSKTSGEESRRFPRLGIKTIVDVEVLGKSAHCRLMDVSLGGLAFVAPWEIGRDVALHVSVPPPEGLGLKKLAPAALEGVVCHCERDMKRDGWQVGVRFAEVAPAAQELIELWFQSFGETPVPAEAKPRFGKH